MHLTFEGVNDAFTGLVKGLHDGSIPAIRRPSRNGGVLQVEEPVTVTYRQPLHRVLFNAARDANPFFHLYEALWMLAGRNDVASVASYCTRMHEYSDDGRTLNGSYGDRWRNRFGFDQLNSLVNHLAQQPSSRRAVLQMWSPEHDLNKVDTSKDVCCLAGESVFRSPEGDTSIIELASRFQTNSEYRFPVYTVDPATGLQGFGWMTNAWKVGIKKVVKVSFDDGSSIRLTADHVVYRKVPLGRPAPGRKSKGFRVEECEAGTLEVGDRVLAELPETANSRRDRDGRRMFKISLADDTKKSNMAAEHREYWKFAVNPDLPDGHDVHHLNENKGDNRLANLEEVDHGEHQRRHKLVDPSWGKYEPKRGNDGRFGRLDNHKIVSIEDDGYTTVFDFTVPGRHNAVLSNGVLVHNCNLSVILSLRDKPQDYADTQQTATWGLPGPKLLDLTVTNRSNDLVWGLLGANVVHFSFLQEYLAARLGVGVGRYHHFTNNLHVYEDNWRPEAWLAGEGDELVRPYGKVYPLVEDPERFERELGPFVERWAGHPMAPASWEEPFFSEVAEPFFVAHRRYRAGDFRGALAWVDWVAADDWRRAGCAWLERRQHRRDQRVIGGREQAYDPDLAV